MFTKKKNGAILAYSQLYYNTGEFQNIRQQVKIKFEDDR